MKPGVMILAVVTVVLGLTLSVTGYGLLGWMFGWLADAPEWIGSRPPQLWMDMPPIVLGEATLSVIDFVLMGVILVLLAALAAVLARGRYSPRILDHHAGEARLLQDLHRGFVRMERRLDSLESTLLQRAGGIVLGRKSN